MAGRPQQKKNKYKSKNKRQNSRLKYIENDFINRTTCIHLYIFIDTFTFCLMFSTRKKTAAFAIAIHDIVSWRCYWNSLFTIREDEKYIYIY